jgi:preprotein translocase subunit SecF
VSIACLPCAGGAAPPEGQHDAPGKSTSCGMGCGLMSRFGRLGNRLYTGDVSIDFVGRRRTWYAISAVIVIVAALALGLRGLNKGIEFKGGVEYAVQMAPTQSSVEALRSAVVGTGLDAASDPIVVTSGNGMRVQTEPMSEDDVTKVENAMKEAGAGEISSSSVGPTWGAQIAHKALTGLLVFVALVVLFIWAYFREWRMSVAAIVALAHDLIITVGVYSLAGFEVTPATVTGLLTILGYSLYDTVVVFDKVRENTRGITLSTVRTYEEAANLAVNQTLVRSINTSVAALLPVGAILYVAVTQLGSGPLKDLALALFVGMAAGTYSSIFIATPLAAQLKMREPSMVAQAKRVMARRAKEASSRGVVTASDGSASLETEPVTATTPKVRVTTSGSAKRSQPTRAPRSKRGKR